MAVNTTFLITGANRGIGKSMAASLVLRPSTTVVAAVRDPSHETAQSLATLPAADGSKLLVVRLDAENSGAGHDSLHDRLVADGITHLDVVIANAGTSSGFQSLLDTTAEDLRHDFEVNSIGTLELFKATWPLMRENAGDAAASKKFVLITSSVGSIAVLDQEAFPGASYGMSKVAANWLAKKLSVEFKSEGLKVGIIHPGWVKTPMGQMVADVVGFPEPPTTIEDSSRQVLERVDGLTLESSGKFVSYDGKAMPW